MSRLMHAALVVVMAACLAGCGINPVAKMYAGPERPDTEIARIKGVEYGDHTFWRGLNHNVRILEVDGVEVPMPPLAENVGVEEVVVEPGKHVLLLEYTHKLVSAHVSLWLVAEAGKTYTAKAAGFTGYKVAMVLVDDATQQPVGGIVGSLDEPPAAPAGSDRPAK